MERMVGSRRTSNLLQHPSNIMNYQSEVQVICGGGKGSCPPQQAEDHEKHSIWSTSIEVVK